MFVTSNLFFFFFTHTLLSSCAHALAFLVIAPNRANVGRRMCTVMKIARIRSDNYNIPFPFGYQIQRWTVKCTYERNFFFFKRVSLSNCNWVSFTRINKWLVDSEREKSSSFFANVWRRFLRKKWFRKSEYQYAYYKLWIWIVLFWLRYTYYLLIYR